MIGTPFYFEEQFTAEEFQKVGTLSLRWSHIDHIVGNCLKALLGITDEQARVMIFPLSLDNRLKAIAELSEISNVSEETKDLLGKLGPVMKALQYVRNTVIHAVIDRDTQGFQLRSRKRSIPKEEVFSTEELTNYAAHLALHLRSAIGEKELPPWYQLTPLPERPAIPEFLRSWFQEPRRDQRAARRSRRRSSR